MRNLLLGLAAAGAAAGAVYALRSRAGSSRTVDLAGKVVLITGGSRGFGLQMARDIGEAGARIAICARDADELERARQDLVGRGVEATTFVCDVSGQDGVEAMVREVEESLGPVDILINNAGIIEVGGFDVTGIEDFEQAMKVMFWGPLYAIRAVLPAMRERGDGSIVNITSIGGRVGVPHMTAYCAAKFATAGLSECLSAELASEGIHVLTVVPGLMRTGSHLHARFRGQQEKEFRWFGIGATAPGLAIGATQASAAVIRAIRRRAHHCVIGLPAQALAMLHTLMPEAATDIFATVNRVALPDGGGTTETISGAEAKARLNSQVVDMLMRSGDRAAEELNQLRPAEA